ncbi:hypothetical protein BFW01_g2688 [Lasiodiplodia theobromae]|nr:hypothetical protein BFW01_g2688 [Lasiodiplodia theobromae]
MSESTEDAKELQRLKYTPVGVPEEEYRHAHGFQDLDGRMGLSYYEGRFDIRPFLSFQVYVTHDTSDQETDRADLAAAVYKELIHEEECIPVRLDIHFLGAVPTSDTASTCVAHYRAAQKAHADDPNMRLVPSYALYDTDWHGFLVTVPRADWREHGGLGLVYFDRACEPPTVAPGEEEPPDPKYIYPTRKVDPSKPPIESQPFTRDVPDDDNLWTNTIKFVYTHIKVKEDWENMYYGKEEEAREKWAREELARRKAMKKAEEEAGDEVKKDQPSQE